jgi:hypothetical protein
VLPGIGSGTERNISMPVMDAPSVTGKASAQAAVWLPSRMYDFENAGRAEDAIAQSSGQ